MSLRGCGRRAGYFLLLCIFLLNRAFTSSPDSQFCLSGAVQAWRSPGPSLQSTRRMKTAYNRLSLQRALQPLRSNGARQLQQEPPRGRCPGVCCEEQQRPTRDLFPPRGRLKQPHHSGTSPGLTSLPEAPSVPALSRLSTCPKTPPVLPVGPVLHLGALGIYSSEAKGGRASPKHLTISHPHSLNLAPLKQSIFYNQQRIKIGM